VARGIHEAGGNVADLLWGAGYGVVEGAVDADADPVEAARGAIEAARSEARRLGVDEQVAAERVAEGAADAAREIYPSAEQAIRSAATPPGP
jgi:16S rRNA G1207 methylase RsmC